MKTHLDNSKERRHYLINKPSVSLAKTRTLYTGTYSTQNTLKPRQHKHNFYEIMLITQDGGYAKIGEKKYTVSSGDLVIYAPKQQHCEWTDGGRTLQSYFFAVKSNDSLETLMQNARLAPVLHSGESYKQFHMLFETLLAESQHKDIRFSDEISNCICQTILLKILHLSPVYTLPTKVNETYQNVKTFIDEHFKENIVFEQLCKQMYVSKYYVSRLFKEYMGVTPSQYVIDKRMEFARSLLNSTSKSIVQISQEVGYSDAYHFSRLFKKEVGVSPRNYRVGFINQREP